MIQNTDAVGFVGATSLERMLRLLIANPQLRQAAAKSAQQRVQAKYLWKQIAEQISQTYEQVMHRPKLVHPAIPAAKPSSHRNSRAA